jgi:predicted phage tail protein
MEGYMPPVIIGAVIAMGAAYAATIGFISMTAALVIGALATAAGSLLTKVPSFSDYASQAEQKQVLRSSKASMTRIYGRTQTSGVLFFAEEQGGEQEKGEWVHLAIAVAAHELDAVESVLLGDAEIGTYGEYASWELHNNRATCDPFLLASCASWKDDMVGVGIAWLRVSLQFDATKFPSGIPNIKATVRGAKVYDPRDQLMKWSSNAALVILDYYRTVLGVPDSDLDWDQFKSAANICDERVLTAAGTYESRYSVSGKFELTEAPAKILESLHDACAGAPTFTGGKHGILVGAYYGPALDEIHDHQLAGDVKIVPETAMRDRTNTITGTFVDPGQNYSETDYPSVSVAEWVEEDGGEVTSDLNQRFVSSAYQAQRLANIKLRRLRIGRTLTLPMNYSGFAYRPGSYIKLYIPALGIMGHEFRVNKFEFSVKSGITLTVREEPADVWADAIGQVMIVPPLTNLPTGGPAAPDALSYATEVIGDAVQGVLSWRNAGSQIAYNQVVVSRAGEPVLTIQVPGESCRLTGLASGLYLAQVTAVAVNGGHSASAGISFTIAVPALPQSIEVTPSNWSLELRPVYAGGQSFGTLCEWWWSTVDVPLAEVEAKATRLGLAAYLVHSGLQPDTQYHYWLRSVNAYGKSALMPVTGKTSFDAASVIAVLDNQIGGAQLREELRTEIAKIADLTTGSESLQASLDQVQISLTALDAREQQVNNLLEHAQTQLGDNYLNVSLMTERLRQQINTYNLDFQDFRDAVFSVDPQTGQITMDAVNAVRSELGASISTVSQHLDAVEAVVKTCVTRAELSADFERLTLVEQQIDGIQGALVQTASKSEVTAVSDTVSQVQQTLDATNTALTQKAAQSQVDAQGQRLTSAEQKIVANTSATTATAERIEQVKAQLEQADQTIASSITLLEQSIATEKQASALRFSQMEAAIDGQNGAISELQQVITGDGSTLASKFENLTASADQVAEAALSAALAGAKADIEQRKAAGSIRREQSAMAGEQEAQAKTLEQLMATLQTVNAELSAQIINEQTTRTTAVESLAQQLSTLDAAYKQADQQVSASIQEESTSRANADGALSSRIDTAQAKADSAAAAVQSESTARANADGALSSRIDTAQAKADSASAAVQSESTARANADGALSSRIDTAQAKADSAAAAVQSESTARANADGALSSRIDTAQAKADGASAAVQTVSQAQASTAGALSALWATKAQINGQGGGFGLSVTMAADGSVMTSFLIDADVFAVLSRATGVASTIHPFVVKNGIVYINKAVLDSADINSLVANYITVTELVGLNIKGSTISGTDIIGGSLNIGAGKAIINSAGKATLQDADVTGKITATSGSMKNLTIEESCTILGTVYAKNIVGDIVTVIPLEHGVSNVITAVDIDRTAYFDGTVFSSEGTTSASIYVNGSLVNNVVCDIPTGWKPRLKSISYYYQIPKNTQVTFAVNKAIERQGDISAKVTIYKK